MSKQAGAIAKEKAVEFRTIVDSFADGLVNPDERFQNFWNYQPVPKVMEWFKSPKKVKVLEAGNRCTKTFSCVYEAIMVYTGMIPPVMREVYPHKIPTSRARLVRIVVQNYSKHWPETIKPILVGGESDGFGGMLPKAWSKWDEQEHMFYGPDGSMLSIVAVDPSDSTIPAVLRGPAADHTYIDELNTEAVFTESFVRGAARKSGSKTISLGYCPQDGFESWTFERLYCSNFNPSTRKRLTEDKINPNIHLIKLTMHDNPSISAEEIQSCIAVLKPWEVAYRVYGEYSARSQNPYFNMDALLKWEESKKTSEGLAVRIIEENVNPETGKFSGSLIPDESYGDNAWRIWEMPENGEKYVMALDGAEGNAEGDYSVGDLWKVTNPTRPVQVAQLRTRGMKAGDFGVQCAMMGTFYGKCLIVPEANAVAGGIIIDRIRNYDNLYKQITAGSQYEEQTERLGWSTNTGSKGPLLEDAYKFLNKCAVLDYCPIQSRNTLLELMSYEERLVKNTKTGCPKIVWGAQAGAHDDCVMAMAMALRVMLHECEKISILRIKKKVVDDSEELWKNHIQESKKPEHIAFRNMKKKSGLTVLRKRFTRSDEYARSRERIQRALR